MKLNKMKCLYLETSNGKNAGPKAPNDINSILKDNYNCELISYKWGNKIKAIKIILKCLFSKDIVLIQYPFLYNQYFYKLLKLRKKRNIILIHDIDSLRGNINNLDSEIKRLKNFNYIIVHNEVMKKFLINKGINKDYIYVLELFDYLCNDNIKAIKSNNKKKNICYTGNLSIKKCPFIHQIDDNKINFNFKLYGIGIEEDISKNVTYHGSFNPEDINYIEGDLGLVWDGNIDSLDSNDFNKSYTKYNNPHKLSCYIARGLPVIVWEEAAIANFVKKYNIGYTIKDFYDINNLNFKDIEQKRKNVLKLSNKVRNGYFTKRVLDKIIKDIYK